MVIPGGGWRSGLKVVVGMYLPLRGQSLPLYFYTQWGVVWLPLMSYYPGIKLLDIQWHWCPSQKHNIQVWARQPHNRSDDESGLGTGIVFGESGQDVVWIPACRSVQCVVTRRGWWRWWHPATSLIHRVGCIGCWCRCCKWGPSLNGWLEEIVFWSVTIGFGFHPRLTSFWRISTSLALFTDL